MGYVIRVKTPKGKTKYVANVLWPYDLKSDRQKALEFDIKSSAQLMANRIHNSFKAGYSVEACEYHPRVPRPTERSNPGSSKAMRYDPKKWLIISEDFRGHYQGIITKRGIGSGLYTDHQMRDSGVVLFPTEAKAIAFAKKVPTKHRLFAMQGKDVERKYRIAFPSIPPSYGGSSGVLDGVGGPHGAGFRRNPGSSRAIGPVKPKFKVGDRVRGLNRLTKKVVHGIVKDVERWGGPSKSFIACRIATADGDWHWWSESNLHHVRKSER